MAKLYFRYGVIGSGKSANARMTHRTAPVRAGSMGNRNVRAR